MSARRSLALGTAAASLLAVVAGAAPASASDVTTTFTVTAGTLSIASGAATASLGSSTSSPLGTTVTGALPAVTVTDNRGSLAGWTGKIASTAFTATVGAETKTIPANKAKAYIPGTLSVVSGTAVPTTTALAAATGVTLGSAATLVTATAVGSNVVSYTPSVQVTIDSTVLAGDYSGTITHTVV